MIFNTRFDMGILTGMLIPAHDACVVHLSDVVGIGSLEATGSLQFTVYTAGGAFICKVADSAELTAKFHKDLMQRWQYLKGDMLPSPSMKVKP